MRKITLMTNEAREAKLNNAHEMSDCQNKTGRVTSHRRRWGRNKGGDQNSKIIKN